jgi:hypothetical protein
MAGTNLTPKVDQTAAGTWTTVAAVDTVPTGLATVSGVVASINDTPVTTQSIVSAKPSATPGSITISTWSDVDAAATGFGLKINWLAWGTATP